MSRSGYYYQVLFPGGKVPGLFQSLEVARRHLAINCYAELYRVRVNAAGKIVEYKWVDCGCNPSATPH